MEREDTQKLPSDERALFAVATELEDIALNDEYFVSRNLYPNVDFYTGLIYRAIGFDPAMFTTLFALGRIPGWIAQYREMLADPNTKNRPPTPGVHRSGRARFRADGRAVIVGLRKRFAGDSSEALSICTAQTSYAATAA